MAESTPPSSIPFQRNLIQLKKKLITVSGNSIVIRKGVNAKMIREKQIFSKSKIRFLISIGEKNDEKAFFLALSSKRIALFQLKKESPIAIFKLDEKIVDHGTVQVLDMERRKEGEFIVKLIIPIAFASGTVRKMQLTVHFCDSQITKQKMKCMEELSMEDEKMRFCVDLGNDLFFGFYEDTIVKSDGLVTRAEEPSTYKKRRIAVLAQELWNWNILLATENGSIRVVRVKDGRKVTSNSMTIFSEGQCVPPYCTLRCREPSVIISTENTVIVGTKRGVIHFLNEQLELRCKIDTEGGLINCLKYKTFSSTAFLHHLNRIHRTHLALAGLVLRCQCGIESISDNHSIKCNTPNLTVIRKNDFGPFRTVADKMTPQCTMCEMYPRTILGYSQHLYEKHGTSIERIGCFLKCGVCGSDFYTRKETEMHSKKCKSRFYSLLKLNEVEEEKDEMEMDQTTDA